MTRAAPTFCVVCQDGPAVGVVAGDRGKGEPVVPGYVASEPPADMSTPDRIKVFRTLLLAWIYCARGDAHNANECIHASGFASCAAAEYLVFFMCCFSLGCVFHAISSHYVTVASP